MQLSLSAVDAVAANSFLKCLYAIALSFEVEFGKTLKSKVQTWAVEAAPFCKRFGIQQRAWKLIMDDVASAIDPDDNANMFNRILKLAEDVRSKKQDFRDEIDLSQVQLGQINDFRLWIADKNENAYNRMLKNVALLGDPDLSREFLDDDTELDERGLADILKRLNAIVKKLSGQQGLSLPTEVADKYRGQEVYKNYLSIKGELNKLRKFRIQQIVRTSGKETIDIKQLIRTLDKEGIPHDLPRKFEGMIDEKGWMYTITGKKMLANPNKNVEMNPNYDAGSDNGYVCKGVPDFGDKEQHYFTKDYKKMKNAKKFGVVSALTKVLPKLQAKWRRDLKVRGIDALKALIVELIYQTSARISNKRAGTDGKQTYGMATLLNKHVTIKGDVIHIKFSAKSGVNQHFKINVKTDPVMRQVKTMLEALKEQTEPNDYLMVYNGKHVNGQMVNKYLVQLGAPKGATIHKFRHARGSLMAKELLAKSPFNPDDKSYSQSDVTKWFVEQVKQIGAELGHVSGENVTANTAIANYIDPNIMKDFFDGLGVRPPANVLKAVDDLKD